MTDEEGTVDKDALRSVWDQSDTIGLSVQLECNRLQTLREGEREIGHQFEKGEMNKLYYHYLQKQL